MLAFRPWIAEIKINPFKLSRSKYFLSIIDICKCQFQVRRCFMSCRLPYCSSLISSTADQLIIHINADKIDIGIFEAHLADKLSLAHSELHMDRMIISEQLGPLTFITPRVKND
ncbi:hypothetical protein D3C81_2033890 [compost metagenome]